MHTHVPKHRVILRYSGANLQLGLLSIDFFKLFLFTPPDKLFPQCFLVKDFMQAVCKFN